ncbi:glycosyltransferase family 9 protein [Endomicrobium proavitum]|uniref:Putative Heptosyltransferase II n=1 Tax=Endomicrobium proavitum TaxID=1408281 RepID=A0A0G3WIR3_9BACT|nr:glycosyltransferase family 9 protein [Endomicrobium proavitum]AKL97780.1 putative Heptosyltransferase II [Endomicrobium proavitum]
MNTNKNFTLYSDCINFPLDRPCAYQKNENARCADCSHYIKISQSGEKTKILIIKLGAMGDVLRTTFLLEGLKEVYPKGEISWIVSPKNAAVLENNKYIDSVIMTDDKTNEFLAKNFFDAVINLDLSPESLALAKLSNKSKLFGYSLDENRNITSSNDFALQWLKMSAYDELKKANTKTYQHWMSKITELPQDNYEIIVPLSEASITKAEDFLKSLNISENKKIIGINPGAGKRWQMKKYRTDGFIETAKYFSNKGYTILLLGAKDDEAEIKEILNQNIKNIYSTGTENSIPDFFAFINLCDVVICADTMALHAAAGLKKNIVAIFGPTSYSEIEIYGRGIKIKSDIECLGCYKQTCDIKNNCMQRVSSAQVIEAVESLVKL